MVVILEPIRHVECRRAFLGNTPPIDPHYDHGGSTTPPSSRLSQETFQSRTPTSRQSDRRRHSKPRHIWRNGVLVPEDAGPRTTHTAVSDRTQRSSSRASTAWRPSGCLKTPNPKFRDTLPPPESNCRSGARPGTSPAFVTCDGVLLRPSLVASRKKATSGWHRKKWGVASPVSVGPGQVRDDMARSKARVAHLA